MSNKDECVTVKDPSSNLLIEQVHCNWSGGCAMGSLGANVGKWRDTTHLLEPDPVVNP